MSQPHSTVDVLHRLQPRLAGERFGFGSIAAFAAQAVLFAGFAFGAQAAHLAVKIPLAQPQRHHRRQHQYNKQQQDTQRLA